MQHFASIDAAVYCSSIDWNTWLLAAGLPAPALQANATSPTRCAERRSGGISCGVDPGCQGHSSGDVLASKKDLLQKSVEVM